MWFVFKNEFNLDYFIPCHILYDYTISKTTTKTIPINKINNVNMKINDIILNDIDNFNVKKYKPKYRVNFNNSLIVPTISNIKTRKKKLIYIFYIKIILI